MLLNGLMRMIVRVQRVIEPSEKRGKEVIVLVKAQHVGKVVYRATIQ